MPLQAPVYPPGATLSSYAASDELSPSKNVSNDLSGHQTRSTELLPRGHKCQARMPSVNNSFLSLLFWFLYLKLLKRSRQGYMSKFDCVNAAVFPHIKRKY